jgi:hypothetical protein
MPQKNEDQDDRQWNAQQPKQDIAHIQNPPEERTANGAAQPAFPGSD